MATDHDLEFSPRVKVRTSSGSHLHARIGFKVVIQGHRGNCSTPTGLFVSVCVDGLSRSRRHHQTLTFAGSMNTVAKQMAAVLQRMQK